jgi:hypothetical protein
VRAFLAGLGHASIIAQPECGRTTDSRAPDFKLTHYPSPALAYARGCACARSRAKTKSAF